MAILRQEWRLQWRSTRFRLGVVVYVLMACSPALVTFFAVRKNLDILIGGNSYLGQLLLAQPFATALLAILISGNGSSREAVAELWIPLASARTSSLAYLLRRWLSQQAILFPVTLLPLSIAWTLAFAAGHPILNLGPALVHWAMMVLPVAWVVGAFWLGVSVIAGGELVALMFSMIGLNLFVALLNQALWHWRLVSHGPLGGLGADRFMNWVTWSSYLARRSLLEMPMGFSASQGMTDLDVTWRWVMNHHALSLGLAMLALVMASGFLRRTQRDLQPIRFNERHPLRSYIGLFNRLRQRHAPDACLAPGERLGLALSGLVLILLVGFQFRYQRTFQDQAHERFAALTQWKVDAMPLDLSADGWKIRGEITDRGVVKSLTEGTFVYHGTVPLAQLAFSLNQGLEVVQVEVGGRRVSPHRRWDRWALDLDPPLAQGDRILVRAQIEGRPSRPFFGFYRGRSFRSFVDGFESYQGARFSRELVDFSRTDPRYALSDRRLDLQPGDLGPVPRYTTWELTPRSTDPSEFGQQVPEEAFQVMTELDVELQAPARWTLADGCGRFSRQGEGRQTLSSRCRTSLPHYVVRGGTYEVLEDAASGISLGVLPGHRDRGRTLLQGLGAVIGLSDKAWPGLQGLRGLAVLEWPPRFEVDLMQGLQSPWWAPPEEELHGSLLSLPEVLVIDGEPLRAEALVGQVMARDLLTRRSIAPSQAYLFKHLFTGLTVRRMGLDERGAVLESKPWAMYSLRVPLLSATAEYRDAFESRLPAVMAELEHRVGSHHFYGAIEDFLAHQDGSPGTIEELFERFQSRSGVSLERFFREHFLESTLPSLRLDNVRRQLVHKGRWQVTGELTNTGTGQSTCPLFVSTETGEERVVVTVESKSSAPFEVLTSAPPLGVQLDPQKTCLRIRYRNSAKLEKADLVGSEVQGP